MRVRISQIAVGVVLALCIARAAPSYLSPSPYDELLQGIDTNDLSKMQRALARGADPNRPPDEDNVSPLREAIVHHNLRAAEFLLDHGTRPDAGDVWGNPLETAVELYDTKIALLLLKHGAKINDEDGNSSLLQKAMASGDRTTIEFLLKHGANPKPLSNLSTPKNPI